MIDKVFDLTIVIPALNEANTIGKVIEEINEALKEKSIQYEILISDNNSDDNTVEVVNEYRNTRVNLEQKRGYGSNLRSAFKNTNSKYVIFFDADGSYDPKHIFPMYKKIRENNLDVVYLNRLKQQEKGAMPILNRYLGTPILTFFINLIYGSKIKDCNSGMRIFDRKKFENIKFISNGMEFASEFFIEVAKYKLIIDDYVGLFRKDYRNEAPHLNRWRDGWRHLKFIISFAPMKIVNSLLFLIVLNYILGFLLTFYKTETGFPRFHTIIALISLNMFIQIICISILNFKQKYPFKIHDKKKFDFFLNLHRKNFFIIFSTALLVVFSILMIAMILLWYFAEGSFFNLELALRLIIFACITSFAINIEMILDNN